MADIESSNYVPPGWYQDGMSGAEEAGDLRFVHSSAAIVRIGLVPIVALENVSITIAITRTPIMAVGSPVPIGFDFGGYSANINGQIVLNSASSLNKSEFFATSVDALVANINQVFTIDIVAQDAQVDEPTDRVTEAFITLKNCQNTGETINLSNNSNIRQSFTAVSTFMERDLATALLNFNAKE